MPDLRQMCYILHLPSPVKVVEVSPGAAVIEAAVLSPDLLSHIPPMVYKAHEAFDPEGSRFDGEGRHLFPCKGKQGGGDRQALVGTQMRNSTALQPYCRRVGSRISRT